MAQTVYGVETTGSTGEYSLVAAFASAAETLDYIQDFIPTGCACNVVYPVNADLPANIIDSEGEVVAQFIGLYQAVKYYDDWAKGDPDIVSRFKVIYSVRP